jgi:predicted ATPase
VPTLTNINNHKALIEILRGDAGAAKRAAETVVELSQEHGIVLYLAWGTLSLRWARARLGEREAAVTALRESLATYTEQANKLYLPFFQGLLAELEGEGQGAESALTSIDQALALAQQTGERWTDALLHRIRGEILLKHDPVNTAPAEEAFLTAIAIAQQQKAKSFELRAAMSMARLWRDQGKPQQARELLAPVYGWFIEGFDTLDLKEAKVLLGELRA